MEKPHHLSSRRTRGFTLIELMIVVVVVAVLAAIALPAYQEQVRKGRRASAQAHLMEIASKQQQYLLDKRAYAANVAALNLTTPTDVSDYYTISVANSAGPPPTFTATAQPTGSQVADLAGQNLTIDNAGAKTPSGKW